MLVGGGVKNHRWLEAAHERRKACSIFHVANDAGNVLFGMVANELLLEGVEREFTRVEQHQGGWCEARNLAAQFRSDRAAGSCDHDCAATDPLA